MACVDENPNGAVFHYCSHADPDYAPFNKTKASPTRNDDFDQIWEQWQYRKAVDAAAADLKRTQLEQEQIKLCGGELDDDVSLCEPMVRVLMDLFGDIDYIDP